MLQALLGLIQVLGAVARRDTDNSRAQGIADVLGIAEYLIDEGSITVQKLQQLTNTVKAMADEGRDPTMEELVMLRTRSDAAHAAIQAVDLSDDAEDGAQASDDAEDGAETKTAEPKPAKAAKKRKR